MTCPKCNSKTAVTASRTPARPGKGWVVKRAEKIVGWYTQDFVVRMRKCKQCDLVLCSVEIPLDDITAMMQETLDGHAPKSVTRQR
ncbi:hypothetical protein CMI37_24605 [Candidatus Pacearchaeota archaeon]|nr:hypothetical protein [Candidatus Pacearchaeota archaeon]